MVYGIAKAVRRQEILRRKLLRMTGCDVSSSFSGLERIASLTRCNRVALALAILTRFSNSSLEGPKSDRLLAGLLTGWGKLPLAVRRDCCFPLRHIPRNQSGSALNFEERSFPVHSVVEPGDEPGSEQNRVFDEQQG